MYLVAVETRCYCRVVAVRSSRSRSSLGERKKGTELEKKKGKKGKKKKKRKKKRKGKVVGKEDLVSRRLGLEVSACVNNRVETTIGRRRGGAERVFERCSPRDSIDQLAAASVEDRTTIVDDRRAEFLRVLFFYRRDRRECQCHSLGIKLLRPRGSVTTHEEALRDPGSGRRDPARRDTR